MRHARADKVSINSAAIRRPELIDEIALNFGSQVCIVAIDAKLEADGKWYCYLNGGRIRTDRTLLEWGKEVADRGAGEILFTSMNHDGVKRCLANGPLSLRSGAWPIPIIASGGAGCMADFRDTFIQGKSDAALAASVFHYGEIKIADLKKYLKQEGISVRI